MSSHKHKSDAKFINSPAKASVPFFNASNILVVLLSKAHHKLLLNVFFNRPINVIRNQTVQNLPCLLCSWKWKTTDWEQWASMQWVASYILFANIARNLNRGSDSFNWVENVQCCRYHLIDFYLTRVQSLSALVTQSLMLWCLHLWMYQLKLFYVVTVADVNAKERFLCLSFFHIFKRSNFS